MRFERFALATWARVWHLSSTERWVLVQALILLPLTSLTLRFMGLQRWQTTLARLAPVRNSTIKTDEPALLHHGRAIARLVEAAARHGLYRATCLPRSLTLWWLLRRSGIDSALCIGVRKEETRFEAHAWEELCGTVLNDSADVRQRFTAFDLAISPFRKIV
jgi:hypothetical protein